VVVDDLNLVSVTVLKLEDDSVLIVHPDAEVAQVVSLQPFESVPGWVGQVAWFPRAVEPIELSLGSSPEIQRQAAAGRLRPRPIVEVLGGLVSEVEDHGALYRLHG
jgi:hypothetical protein